jgi:peptide subunit release factor 1 (eRF1)
MIQEQLRRLAEIHSEDIPVLSVSVDLRPQTTGERPSYRAGLVVLRDRFRAIEQALLPRGPALDAFHADTERVEHYLTETVAPAAQGVALFAADHLGIFESIVAGTPLETDVTFASHFDLYHLARLAEDYETAVIAVVDTNTARLFVMQLGHFTEVPGPDQDPYWFSKKQHVGPNQLRFQRHTVMKRRQFAREVAIALADLVEEEGATRVILAGDTVALSMLRAELSPHVSSLVIADTLPIDIRASRTSVVEQVEPALTQAEAKQERTLGDEVLEAAQAGGLGVVGAEATAHALTHGQVDVLVLDDQANLSAEQQSMMVRQAMLTGATVEVLANHPTLQIWGGIGALLRYRLGSQTTP